jgi:hypothetical protein
MGCRHLAGRTRPAIANERLSRNANGQVALLLESPHRDGVTHVIVSALAYMQRLAALVPACDPFAGSRLRN